MNRIFVKKDDLTLVNGGYVVTGEKETPMYNEEFIAVQKHAEWVVTFAEKAKGKDFIGKKADSIADVKLATMEALANKDVEYVNVPKPVKMDLTAKLQKEAMDFINFQGETTKAKAINNFLQSFNILNDFETFGLYFNEDICKLNKIYTMEEVIKAVTEVIDLID
jgi:Holliday junction resolvase